MSRLRAVLSSLPWLPGLRSRDCAALRVRVDRLEQDLDRLRVAVADRYGVIT